MKRTAAIKTFAIIVLLLFLQINRSPTTECRADDTSVEAKSAAEEAKRAAEEAKNAAEEAKRAAEEAKRAAEEAKRAVEEAEGTAEEAEGVAEEAEGAAGETSAENDETTELKEAFLADKHKTAGFECSSCHKETPPAIETPTAVCLTCHADYRDVAASYIDPHNAHMEFTNCSDCHHAHKKSESQCLQCHTFNQETP